MDMNDEMEPQESVEIEDDENGIVVGVVSDVSGQQAGVAADNQRGPVVIRNGIGASEGGALLNQEAPAPIPVGSVGIGASRRGAFALSIQRAITSISAGSIGEAAAVREASSSSRTNYPAGGDGDGQRVIHQANDSAPGQPSIPSASLAVVAANAVPLGGVQVPQAPPPPVAVLDHGPYQAFLLRQIEQINAELLRIGYQHTIGTPEVRPLPFYPDVGQRPRSNNEEARLTHDQEVQTETVTRIVKEKETQTDKENLEIPIFFEVQHENLEVMEPSVVSSNFTESKKGDISKIKMDTNPAGSLPSPTPPKALASLSSGMPKPMNYLDVDEPVAVLNGGVNLIEVVGTDSNYEVTQSSSCTEGPLQSISKDKDAQLATTAQRFLVSEDKSASGHSGSDEAGLGGEPVVNLHSLRVQPSKKKGSSAKRHRDAVRGPKNAAVNLMLSSKTKGTLDLKKMAKRQSTDNAEQDEEITASSPEESSSANRTRRRSKRNRPVQSWSHLTETVKRTRTSSKDSSTSYRMSPASLSSDSSDDSEDSDFASEKMEMKTDSSPDSTKKMKPKSQKKKQNRSATFPPVSHYRSRQRSHAPLSSKSPGVVLKCDFCQDISSNTRKDLIAHLKTHEEDIPLHLCKSCPMVRTSLDKLLSHMSKHSVSRKLPCPECNDFVSSSLSELYRHCKTAHPDLKKIFKCDQCEKEFLMPATYRAHLKQHQVDDLGDLTCDRCNNAEKFKTRADLKEHMKYKHGDALGPFKCDQCEKAFSHKSSLRGHVKAHHENVRYECPQCPKFYMDKRELRYHLGTVHGGNAFACELCGKKFGKQSKLKRHAITHSTEKREKCKL